MASVAEATGCAAGGMNFERAINLSLGNFTGAQGSRLQSSRPHWRRARVHVGLMQMTIAAVFAASFAISVGAEEFLAGSGTPAAAFPNPDRRHYQPNLA